MTAAVDLDALAAEARRVLERNRQRGVSEWDGKRYDFVCPSQETYPFQWFWDSAFHAIALLHVYPAPPRGVRRQDAPGRSVKGRPRAVRTARK